MSLQGVRSEDTLCSFRGGGLVCRCKSSANIFFSSPDLGLDALRSSFGRLLLLGHNSNGSVAGSKGPCAKVVSTLGPKYLPLELSHRGTLYLHTTLRGYHRDPFLHSLLRTREYSLRLLGVRSLGASRRGFCKFRWSKRS